MSAIKNVKKDVNECAERVGEAEVWLSATEDSITSLQARVQALENKNKDLEEKMLDLDARRSNLRLVNLPEGAEGEDACSELGTVTHRPDWRGHIGSVRRIHQTPLHQGHLS